MVRVQDKLYLTDATLTLTPFFHSVAHLQSVQVPPDGKFVVVETELERHRPEEHKLLNDQAKKAGGAAHEDVRVLVIDPKTRTVVAESRERDPLLLPVVREGYVEVLPKRFSRWAVRYVPFGGSASLVAEVASKCDPHVQVVNSDEILLSVCSTQNGGRGAIAVSLEGKRLWAIPGANNLAWPRYAVAVDGSEVALSRLRLVEKASGWVPVVHDRDVAEQQIDIFDASTGKERLRMVSSLARSYAQNYSLAPQGDRFAVLNKGNIEVFDLPLAP